MKRKVIAFGSHDKKMVFQDSGQTVACVFCDQPIHFSAGGMFTSNFRDADTPFEDIAVAIGKECMIEVMEEFVKGVQAEMQQMEKVKPGTES